MVGRSRGLVKPVRLQLCGNDLPWVSTAEHLGHTLHESGTMSQDTKVKRARFISDAVEIRETIKWASPVEILKALKVYCSSFHGCMIWDLGSNMASQLFNSWNTAVQLTWDCRGPPGRTWFRMC